MKVWRIETAVGSRSLKVFGDAFVEPQRNIINGTVYVAVSDFVAKVFGDSASPPGKHHQRSIIFDEERAAVWKQRMFALHVVRECRFVFKKINVDRFVRDRNVQ